MDVFEDCQDIHTNCQHTQVARYLRFALKDGGLFWEYYDTEDDSWVVVEEIPIQRPSTVFSLIDRHSDRINC